jgi:RimJ/RimL family protein N-acetyltransferase
MQAEPITLRPVTSADDIFLLQLYSSTRADEMGIVPWSEEQKQAFVSAQFNAQQNHYRKTYPVASHDIIIAKDREVGSLYVARLDTEIRIVDITLLPSDRNRGIGTSVLLRLIEEANRSAKLLRIYVEVFNPSLRLFERLGFTKGAEQGIHIALERRAEIT